MRKIKKAVIITFLFLVIVSSIEAVKVIIRQEQEKGLEENLIKLEEVKAKAGKQKSITMNAKDIYKGDLIVVNNRIPYQFNADETLVSIYDNKSSSYFVKDKNVLLQQAIIKSLNAMMDSFYQKTQHKEINVVSGYRTKAYQQRVYQQNVDENGTLYAMSYVANAGCSEHHTGLAIDLGCFNPKDKTSKSFDGNGELDWFNENAYLYGFILRYPETKKDVTGIAYEPWHFRYVGLPHSYIIWQKGFCLEEYIDYLKKNSSENKHVVVKIDGKEYEVYYVNKMTFKVPRQKEYTVSGDNKEGFIVTVEDEL